MEVWETPAHSIRVTGAALDYTEAAPLFTTRTELKGAEEQHITVNGQLIEPSSDGLTATALTDDVKDVVIAHAEPEQPATGRRIVLRAEGTITIHITAVDVRAGRAALEVIEYEDFDVDLRTRHGHLIGHATSLSRTRTALSWSASTAPRSTNCPVKSGADGCPGRGAAPPLRSVRDSTTHAQPPRKELPLCPVSSPTQPLAEPPSPALRPI